MDGELELCVSGCNDCSSGVCTSCYSGYSLDSNSNTCLICGMNCLTCSTTNTEICYTCAPGSYLTSSTCKPCDPICITCTGNPLSCTSCPPGQYYAVSQQICTDCPRNCITCDSSGLCTSCRNGFALVNSTCRSCIISCSSCSPNDITVCTSCAKGLQLVNGACVSCPEKCTSCFNGICAVCVAGYHPNSAGTCVQDCLMPCATCVDNKPSVCKSCFSKATLVGSTCVQDLSCNSFNNCTSCGQGNGYILVGANCLRCANISNCLQCRPTNNKKCSLCATGFYINDDDTCSSCPSSCVSCMSNSVCTGCAEGFTFAEGFTKGQCLKCLSPCQTCYGTQTYCTTCVSGYTKVGWKCQSNLNVGFSITLNAISVAIVLNNIDSIVSQILTLIGANTTNTDLITFKSFKLGSVTMTGFATPTTVSSSSIVSSTASLSSGLTSSTLGGFPVTSTSVVSNGVETSTSNLPLIVGLSVGIPILIGKFLSI